MRSWLSALDRILRGEVTQPTALRGKALNVPVGGLALVILGLTMFYGACMGVYALFRGEHPDYMQCLASTVKVPLLFFLTLGITFPSLYVTNALVGSRLSIVVIMQLLVASLGVNTAVLASMGTIVAFFSLSTSNYPFMLLLNVGVFAASGILGVLFLLRTLQRLTAAQLPPTPEVVVLEPVETIPNTKPTALDSVAGRAAGRQVRLVFWCWVLIFALVGSQMGWVLRPFIGAPDMEFTWFRPRGSSFFEGVGKALPIVFSSGTR